jgi:hypothetical protein
MDIISYTLPLPSTFHHKRKKSFWRRRPASEKHNSATFRIRLKKTTSAPIQSSYHNNMLDDSTIPEGYVNKYFELHQSMPCNNEFPLKAYTFNDFEELCKPREHLFRCIVKCDQGQLSRL